MPQTPKKRKSLSTGVSVNSENPQPVRGLDTNGIALWHRLWSMNNPWISKVVDLDHVTMLCESVDERFALREVVLATGDWRDLVALRALDDQIDKMGACPIWKSFSKSNSCFIVSLLTMFKSLWPREKMQSIKHIFRKCFQHCFHLSKRAMPLGVSSHKSAPGGNRTPNRPGRNRLLYPLSYGR